MTTVDEILATGEYESRTWGLIERCRESCPGNGLWVCAGHYEPWEHLTTEQVALAIERDQHRAECPGLPLCRTHPVPFVILWPLPTAIPAHTTIGQTLTTHHEAMNAARELAVTA